MEFYLVGSPISLYLCDASILHMILSFKNVTHLCLSFWSFFNKQQESNGDVTLCCNYC